MPSFAVQPEPCWACPAQGSCYSFVPGSGPLTASVALIGQGPGEMEAYDHKPFIGPAGKLLEVMLNRAGLRRGELYIDNVVRCWMPKNVKARTGNREPKDREIAYCTEHYLLPTLRSMSNLIGVVLVGGAAHGTFLPIKGESAAGAIRSIKETLRG